MPDLPIKYRILCPGSAHTDFRKILAVVEVCGERISATYNHCDYHGCRRWFRTEVTPDGCARLTELPPNYHLDLETLPTLVVDNA
jgi:hypothetical protein